MIDIRKLLVTPKQLFILIDDFLSLILNELILLTKLFIYFVALLTVTPLNKSKNADEDDNDDKNNILKTLLFNDCLRLYLINLE